jgi:hypothetical protein
VEGWRSRVSARQLERTAEILNLFGLDGIYGEAPMPDRSCAYAMMAGK